MCPYLPDLPANTGPWQGCWRLYGNVVGPRAEAVLVCALIRRIDYHGEQKKVSLAFHSAEHPPLLAEIARLTNQETV